MDPEALDPRTLNPSQYASKDLPSPRTVRSWLRQVPKAPSQGAQGFKNAAAGDSCQRPVSRRSRVRVHQLVNYPKAARTHIFFGSWAVLSLGATHLYGSRILGKQKKGSKLGNPKKDPGMSLRATLHSATPSSLLDRFKARHCPPSEEPRSSTYMYTYMYIL